MAETSNSERGLRKERKGAVVSRSGDKSIVVLVERRLPHPQYGKVVRETKRFHAHDEKNEAKVGDQVVIVETRPLSKSKRWRLTEILNRA